MSLDKFKSIIQEKGRFVPENELEIFQQYDLRTSFGLFQHDTIRVIIYDASNNPLPQANFGLVRYINKATQPQYYKRVDNTDKRARRNYTIDVKKLIKDAGYKIGIFTVEMMFVNNRLGTQNKPNRAYIQEISPSRTEVRVLPYNVGDVKLNGLSLQEIIDERYDAFLYNEQFKEDIYEAIEPFLDLITVNDIKDLLINQVTQTVFNEIIKQYFKNKTSEFDRIINKMIDHFKEAVRHELLDKDSLIGPSYNVFNPNFGNDRPTTRVSIDFPTFCFNKLLESLEVYVPKLVDREVTQFVEQVEEFEFPQIRPRVEFTRTTAPTTPIVSTNIITEITNTTAVAGGAVVRSGGLTVTDRGICFSKSENPTITNNRLSVGAGLGNFTVNLTNLDFGTLYYVRAYAINSQGISYGTQVSFTTVDLKFDRNTAYRVSLYSNQPLNIGKDLVPVTLKQYDEIKKSYVPKNLDFEIKKFDTTNPDGWEAYNRYKVEEDAQVIHEFRFTDSKRAYAPISLKEPIIPVPLTEFEMDIEANLYTTGYPGDEKPTQKLKVPAGSNGQPTDPSWWQRPDIIYLDGPGVPPGRSILLPGSFKAKPTYSYPVPFYYYESNNGPEKNIKVFKDNIVELTFSFQNMDIKCSNDVLAIVSRAETEIQPYTNYGADETEKWIFEGFYDWDTGEPLDSKFKVTRDINIFMKFKRIMIPVRGYWYYPYLQTRTTSWDTKLEKPISPRWPTYTRTVKYAYDGPTKDPSIPEQGAITGTSGLSEHINWSPSPDLWLSRPQQLQLIKITDPTKGGVYLQPLTDEVESILNGKETFSRFEL